MSEFAALSLKWLAAFGVTHGLHEWGDLFIPIQRAYLSQPVTQFLYVLQLVLLGTIEPRLELIMVIQSKLKNSLGV